MFAGEGGGSRGAGGSGPPPPPLLRRGRYLPVWTCRPSYWPLLHFTLLNSFIFLGFIPRLGSPSLGRGLGGQILLRVLADDQPSNPAGWPGRALVVGVGGLPQQAAHAAAAAVPLAGALWSRRLLLLPWSHLAPRLPHPPLHLHLGGAVLHLQASGEAAAGRGAARRHLLPAGLQLVVCREVGGRLLLLPRLHLALRHPLLPREPAEGLLKGAGLHLLHLQQPLRFLHLYLSHP